VHDGTIRCQDGSPIRGLLSVLGATAPRRTRSIRPVRLGVAVEQVGYTG